MISREREKPPTERVFKCAAIAFAIRVGRRVETHRLDLAGFRLSPTSTASAAFRSRRLCSSSRKVEETDKVFYLPGSPLIVILKLKMATYRIVPNMHPSPNKRPPPPFAAFPLLLWFLSLEGFTRKQCFQ